LWVVGGLLVSASAFARNTEAPAGTPTVALAALPVQAQATYRLIIGGGPFPYDKDGTVFGNRERRLPASARGHYREYTVKTPGVSHRGARRIVCGGKPPTQPEACFYTDDHYASFRLIAR
jgi:ribonuclease T1